MEDMNYKPNSHKFREAQAKKDVTEKKVEKIVSGNVKTKKKSGGSKLFSPEDMDRIKSYIRDDVVIPNFKDVIWKIIKNGAHMLIFREPADSRDKFSGSKVSYNRCYGSEGERRHTQPARVPSRFDYDDIIFETRGDAEAVLVQMDAVIEEYGQVSVLDLYDMAGITAPDYTSKKYGWTNISTSRAVRDGDGYVLRLPKAMPLD